MNCREMKKTNSKMADLLLDPPSVSAEARLHIEACADCAGELAELRSTMSMMDEWAAPGVNPFFDAKLLARLRSEQQAQPAGFVERWKARFLYGSRLRMQPLMAGALAVILLAGGGTYADLAWQASRQPQESAAVRDLQSLDENAQVFQQLDSIDQSAGDQDTAAQSASPAND
jgi:hypothetical protein